jgi:uncharacterized protein (TIGR02265 family)
MVSAAVHGYSGSVFTTVPLGFRRPNLVDPLDVAEHLRLIPDSATVKGLVIDSCLDAVRDAQVALPTNERFTPFRDYSMRMFVELNVACARAISPDKPLPEALCIVGRHLFPKFTSSLLGRVMYGVFRGDVTSILRMAQKSFEQTQNMGRVKTTVIDSHTVRLHFSNTYTFIDTYHVGIMQGTLQACGVEGEVLVNMASLTEGDLLIGWRDPSQ